MRKTGVLGVALVLLVAPLAAEAYDRLVNPFQSCSLSGTPEYNTLQEAVDAASPGDHIGVCPGGYFLGEAVASVTKSVTITGIGAAIVTSFGGVSGGPCVDVSAQDVTIRYLTIRDCEIGIRVQATATGALIQNNRFPFNLGASVRIDAANAIVQNNLFEGGSLGVAIVGNVVGST